MPKRRRNNERMDRYMASEIRALREADLNKYDAITKELGNLKPLDAEGNISVSFPYLHEIKYKYNQIVKKAQELSEYFSTLETPEQVRESWFSKNFVQKGIPELVDAFSSMKEITPMSSGREELPLIPNYTYVYVGDFEADPFYDRVATNSIAMRELYKLHGLRFFEFESPFAEYMIGAEHDSGAWLNGLYSSAFRGSHHG